MTTKFKVFSPKIDFLFDFLIRFFLRSFAFLAIVIAIAATNLSYKSGENFFLRINEILRFIGLYEWIAIATIGLLLTLFSSRRSHLT